ncbi:MAG TPA: SRPBCC domain-containing protein [Steroidobacteraceae bacterium]|nr:SRPBCC domain-containing protein [Steroidobacteraceae bacterium]
MVDILHRVGIKAPVSKVYGALSTVEGIAAWWTRDASGAAAPGENIELQFHTPNGERIGGMAMEVVALEPDKHVHWRFRSGPDEWIDTDATFELSQDGEFTIVRFGHRNWREAVEFTEHCSTKWATFMLSLKDLVETGRGRPAPNDVWIGNWH